MTISSAAPEYNQTGADFRDRTHFRYFESPLLDIHAHVVRTRPAGASDEGPVSLSQAETMLAVAEGFGIACTWTMCPPEDIPALRERFGSKIRFNGPIAKRNADTPDDEVYRTLDRYLEQGIEMIKFWAAPRGRDRGLFIDAPWRIEAARRARAANVRVVMVHVADPDAWFATTYADVTRYGTKADQYLGLCRMIETFPDLTWIAAHLGGDPEHPDHLESLLERYPNLYFDTSATKWQVREVSARTDATRGLICRHANRFLFGSDLVTREGLSRGHYESRYWCQRTLWESTWQGQSPIADLDYKSPAAASTTPPLRGIHLPFAVLKQVYYDNVARIMGIQ